MLSNMSLDEECSTMKKNSRKIKRSQCLILLMIDDRQKTFYKVSDTTENQLAQISSHDFYSPHSVLTQDPVKSWEMRVKFNN